MKRPLLGFRGTGMLRLTIALPSLSTASTRTWTTYITSIAQTPGRSRAQNNKHPELRNSSERRVLVALENPPQARSQVRIMGKKSRDGDSPELRLGGERGAFRSPKIGPWPFYSQLLLPPSRLILPRPTCWASFVPGAEPRGREGSYFTSEQNKTSKMEKEFISHSFACFVRSPSRVGRHIAN